jgi:hypothetical protein
MTTCVESHGRRRATFALGNPEAAVELDLNGRYHGTHRHSGTGNSLARRSDDRGDPFFERHHRPRAVDTRHRRVIDAPGRRAGDEGAVIVLEGRGKLNRVTDRPRSVRLGHDSDPDHVRMSRLGRLRVLQDPRRSGEGQNRNRRRTS